MYIQLTVLVLQLLTLLGNVKCQLFWTQSGLGGLFCPVFTPIDENGAVNVTVIPEYAKYIKNNGLDGVVVAAKAGEGWHLSVQEKMKIYDAWCLAAKPHGLKVIAYIGGEPEIDVLKLAAYVAVRRVHGILLRPMPFYHTPERIVSLLAEVASVAEDVPIFYDDNHWHGGLCHVHDDTVKTFELATERVEYFAGFRTTLREAVIITASTKISQEQELFIYGHISIASATLLGYESFITTSLNLFPELINDIIHSVNNGDVAAARRLQQALNEVMIAITSQGDRLTTLKIAFELISGIKVGPPRVSFLSLTRKEVNTIEKLLEEIDIKISK